LINGTFLQEPISGQWCSLLFDGHAGTIYWMDTKWYLYGHYMVIDGDHNKHQNHLGLIIITTN